MWLDITKQKFGFTSCSFHERDCFHNQKKKKKSLKSFRKDIEFSSYELFLFFFLEATIQRTNLFFINFILPKVLKKIYI